MSRENGDRIILRKTSYVGGMGNLAGGRRELTRGVRSWYRSGQVLVEHRLRLEETAGSLVTTSGKGMRFKGVDVQRVEGGRWTGFSYPHPDKGLTRKIRGMSLRIAALLRRMNARGEVNVDWGIVRDARGRKRPVALECNFRHNGFGYLMRFAEDYFGRRAWGLHVRYLENLRMRRSIRGFADLERALGKVRLARKRVLIDRPGLRRGAAIMLPPKPGRCALALFGESAAYVERLEAAVRAGLG